MMSFLSRGFFCLPRWVGIILAAIVLCMSTARAQSPSSTDANAQQSAQDQDKNKPAENGKDQKSLDAATTKLRIHVMGGDKPVGNASVYVRFPVAGGLFHHDKLAELNLKTNEDGSAKVPDIPRGKILIQVVAKGWKTYGKWFEIDSDVQTVEIKLEAPPHWY
jgi:hypothetical protein